MCDACWNNFVLHLKLKLKWKKYFYATIQHMFTRVSTFGKYDIMMYYIFEFSIRSTNQSIYHKAAITCRHSVKFGGKNKQKSFRVICFFHIISVLAVHPIQPLLCNLKNKWNHIWIFCIKCVHVYEVDLLVSKNLARHYYGNFWCFQRLT